jgi:D-tyrosyl-tRNA(Tyr) deacylase
MRALIQRVKHAQVTVDGQVVGRIGGGILTLLGVGKADTAAEAERIASKILKLRIFEDEQGKMNRSLIDIGGEHLIVSQFTLFADTAKGNRPSFVDAAPPALAKELYGKVLELCRLQGIRTEGGTFQAHMEVSLLNDGPVTLMIDTDGQA